MTKLALFLAITATLFLTSCRVQKQITKQETKQEIETKVDSSGSIKKDVVKESKIETVTTEVIDTTVQVNSKGEIVSGTTGQKTTAVKVRKTKTTKTHAEIKEVDKTHAKTDVKKKQEVKQETKVATKDVQKSGFILAWYWWILILLAVIAGLAFKFRKFFGF